MDFRFLFNKYVRHVIERDGFVWDYPGERIGGISFLIGNDEAFLEQFILVKHHRLIDVGANVGAWTVRASGFYDSIVSIEPLPKIFNSLRRNLRLNHITNVETIQKFASSEDSVTAVGIGRFVETDTVIKLDAEGMAGQVVTGALREIELFKPLIVLEVHSISESQVPDLLPSYRWERRYRAETVEQRDLFQKYFGHELFAEDGQQLFLIGSCSRGS